MAGLIGWGGVLTGLSVVVSLTVLAWMASRARQLEARQRRLGADLAAAMQEIERLAALCTRLSAHAGRVERTGRDLTERLEIMELRTESRSFDQAIDSARRGADPLRLERQFGLSEGEAGLVTLLHGRRGRISGERPTGSQP